MVRSLLTVLAAWAAAALCAAAAAAAPLPPTGTLDAGSDADRRYAGEQTGSFFGSAVAPAGDVNGDGIPDMIVGAPASSSPGREGNGSAWVVFGEREPLAPPVPVGAAPGFRIDGAAAGDAAGDAVAGVGDLDGDGLDDLLVGAPRADGLGRADAGVAYLVPGRAGTEPVDLAAPGAARLVVVGGGAGDRLGVALAALPDANGDGRGDLVVGAPGADRDVARGADGAYVPDPAGVEDAGAAIAVFTPDLAGGPVTIDAAALGRAGYRIRGVSGRAGRSLAVLPDWNGDGRAEIALGAKELKRGRKTPGAAYVVWGAAGPGTIDLAALGDGGIELRSAFSHRAGSAVASIGDFDGDGRGDLAVGAQSATANFRTAAGRVTVVFARSAPGQVRLLKLRDGGMRLDGEHERANVGTAVAGAGDVNGDGLADLLIGSPRTDPFARADAGAAYVVFGGPRVERLDLALLGTRGYRIAGAAPDDRLGNAVAGLGDVSGDGRADVALGSPRADGTAADAGLLSLVFGPAPPLPSEPPAPADPGAEEEVELDGCTAVTNVEVIVDDSGSMLDTDPGRLRAKALELLLDKERNAGEQLGAVEFGSLAELLFQPVVLGETPDAGRAVLRALIRERIQGDGGGTNYNRGFRAAQEVNPDAGAIVFLTDGGHNEGRYAALHQGGPPVFVIGLGIGAEGRLGERLQHMADETQGRYFPDVGAGQLQPVLNQIDSRLNCDVDLATDADRVKDNARPDEVVERLEPGTHSSDVIVSWDDRGDEIALRSISLRRGGRHVAGFKPGQLARALRGERVFAGKGLRIRGEAAPTYLSLRVSGLRRGKLVIRFKPARLRGRERERVVTQIAESRRRR